MIDYQEIIDKYYPAGTTRRDIYMHHCRQVADKALAIAHNKGLGLPDDLIEAAAMLHDIGIVMTDAPSIDCHGELPYICHGIAGAALIRENSYPEEIARVAERHTGAGISVEDIDELNLPLPRRDYMPQSLLERLICYADKFYSKSGEMKEKSLENVRNSMSRHSSATLARFEKLHYEFS